MGNLKHMATLNLPSMTVFCHAAYMQKSSMVSRRAKIPISFTLGAALLSQDHSLSTPSPSIRQPPSVKFNEKGP